MRSRNQGREEVLIRDMKSEEIKEVSQIWLSANLEAHDFIPASYWKGNLDLVREELPLAKVRVYEEEGKILGFLGRNGEEIEGIFVRKECRSRGIGRALLKDAKQSRERLRLHVYQKNRRARTFYLREGFWICSEGIDEGTGEKEYCMLYESQKDSLGGI